MTAKETAVLERIRRDLVAQLEPIKARVAAIDLLLGWTEGPTSPSPSIVITTPETDEAGNKVDEAIASIRERDGAVKRARKKSAKKKTPKKKAAARSRTRGGARRTSNDDRQPEAERGLDPTNRAGRENREAESCSSGILS